MAKLNVNGTVHTVEVEPDTPLLWVIREQLGMTGTKYGCGIAQCGACTVHIDGAATRSCSLPVSAVSDSQKIVTIEGLSPDGQHPVQKAWLALDVPQCGYCQVGMIMASAALLAKTPTPTRRSRTSAVAAPTTASAPGSSLPPRAAKRVAAEKRGGHHDDSASSLAPQVPRRLDRRDRRALARVPCPARRQRRRAGSMA